MSFRPHWRRLFRLSVALVFLAIQAFMSAQETTFNVDMSCAPPDFENVFVTGPWCGWCANEEFNTMTDPDGDGVYSIAIPELTGTIEYKYAINGFMDQENLINDMLDGAVCAPITDYNGYANRTAPAGSAIFDFYGTCDGICNDVPPAPGGTVLFRVDMGEYEGSFGTVNVNGSFNGWCGSCAVMTDDDGDMIYELAVDLPGGLIEYKFTLDGWSVEEIFNDGAECTLNNQGYINRFHDVQEGGVALDVVCWNSCNPCGFDPTLGCNDPVACNYEVEALTNDGSCIYNGEACDDGNALTINDTLVDCICAGEAVVGTGGETILFQESFANGFDGSNGNGAWTASDNLDGNLWIWVTPEGQGLYSDMVTPTGSTHPGGYYSDNLDGLQSTTSHDGWMIFDNDFWHNGAINADNPAYDTEGTLTSPWMDFQETGSVVVSWESFFRYCCYSFAPIYLEVGYAENGVVNWVTFDGHGNFIESANSASENPMPVSVDVSCAAAYRDSVQLRFAYRQAPEVGNGYSHYFWGIDDVVVSSNDAPTDIEITQITTGDVSTVWEYRLTPIEQASQAANGGLVAGLVYKNKGTESQYNVDVIIEILDGDSIPIFTLADVVDTSYSAIDAPMCPSSSQETLYVATGWEPTQVGKYFLRISILPENADATPENNVLVKDFFYTEDLYGHDDDEALDQELFPRLSEDIPDFYDPNGYGNIYHCPNPGSVAYGIAVTFGAGTGSNASGEIEPLEFATRLYTLDGNTDIVDSPYEEKYWVLNVSPNPTGDPNVQTYLAFDEPIDMQVWNPQSGGNYYFASVVSEFETPSQLTVLAEPNSDSDYSTGEYARTSNGDFIWFTARAYTPSIRLITQPFIAGCNDPLACNYNPIAEFSDGSCQIVGQPCNDGLANTVNDVVTESCGCEGVPLVAGCTSPDACNYNPDAVIDDGSCCVCDSPEGVPASLFGEWRFSEEAGALAIGPEPGSTEWYSSPQGGLTDFQYDDRWILTEDGEFLYNNNGGTMNPFDGYIETIMTIAPSTYTLELQAGPNGEDLFTVSGLTTGDGAEICGWMGVWDSGPTYTISELTEDRLVLSALQQGGDCINPVGSGYFTLIFDRVSEGFASCPVYGCTDATAFNFNPAANNDDGSCVYFATSCEFIGFDQWQEIDAGLYSDSALWHYVGTQSDGQWVLHMPTLVTEPASGSLFAVQEWSNLTISNLPPGLEAINMPTSMGGGEQLCVSYSGTPTEVGEYPILVLGDLTVSLFGSPYTVGPFNVVGSLEILPNPNPIAGCTYGNAANYVVFANVDDGSCVFAGCMSPDADNYQPLATVDDGTCVFGECESVCPGDINGDGFVNTNDLLGLLGYFGLPCEE